jgi:hypothetical protein
MISPIKIGRKIFCRQDRSRVGIRWQPEAAPEPQECPPELRWGQVRELGHAVGRRRVHLLVPTRSPQIRPEHREPELVLLLRAVRLAVPPLEQLEVLVLRTQPAIRAIHDLSNQRIRPRRRRRSRDDDEQEEEREERESTIHWFSETKWRGLAIGEFGEWPCYFIKQVNTSEPLKAGTNLIDGCDLFNLLIAS